MRPRSRGTRGAALALALAVFLPALTADAPARAESKRKSLAACTSFVQDERADEDGLDFHVGNQCPIPVTCQLRWTAVCAPDAPKRRTKKHESTSIALASGETATRSAIASCGYDGWAITDIRWSCEPASD
ncbi:MAG: hypothetical protein R2939_15950 [Kofleriaceae bacterium]